MDHKIKFEKVTSGGQKTGRSEAPPAFASSRAHSSPPARPGLAILNQQDRSSRMFRNLDQTNDRVRLYSTTDNFLCGAPQCL
jgi:hypothetical protein